MSYSTTPGACADIKAAVEAMDAQIVPNADVAAKDAALTQAQSDLKDLQDAVVAYLAKVDASETATTERTALDALLPSSQSES